MQITITFDTAENRNAFAAKTGYANDNGVDVTVHSALLALAKSSAGYTSAAQATAGEQGEYIVKAANAGAFASVATLVSDLGAGFYRVTSTDFVALAAAVDSAEDVNAPVKLLSTLEGTDVVDPLSADAQWARIRVASRHRPFPTAFGTYTANPVRKPELIVVDSGIDFTHPEFAGLETQDLYVVPALATFPDTSGHGTGVASAACGTNVGVFNHVKLVNVRVFSAARKPTLLELGETMDAILAHQVATPGVAKVVNMSWNTPKSAFLEGKIQALIDAGLTVVAAAGNEGLDVANLTPAGMASVLTIAASDKDDVAAGFNDFAAADATITTSTGQFLDAFAPGVDVTLAKRGGGYFKVSGSSASAGYASGSVAAYMALVAAWPQSPSTVVDFVHKDATKGLLLLDPAKFSENQNKVVHLVNGENDNLTSMDYYLGAFDSATAVINGNIASYVSIPAGIDGSKSYSIVWDDAALEADFASFVTVNAQGEFTVNKPTVGLPTDTNLKLVRFKVRCSTENGVLVRESPGLIFFVINPNFDSDASTEVASALENLNSQSFFAAWNQYMLK